MRLPKVGDVVRSPSGLLRIVRSAKSRRHGDMRVSFTIQHCSWTGRAITTYSWSELRRIGYVLTRAKVPLKTNFDKLLAKDFECPPKEQMNFKCCDVRGIP